jgi:hypothetical protein
MTFIEDVNATEIETLLDSKLTDDELISASIKCLNRIDSLLDKIHDKLDNKRQIVSIDLIVDILTKEEQLMKRYDNQLEKRGLNN